MFTLLYVDDEPGLLEIGKLFLESDGDFFVTTVLSGKLALDQLGQHDFDAVISDYQMPEMNGIEFLKHVRKSFGTIPFILFTGRGREEVVIEAINNGVDFYLQKGGAPQAQFAELAHKVRQAISRKQAETALSDSERRLADLINFLPDATFAIDTRGVVIAWNRAMERMTGVSTNEVLGKGDYAYALPFYHERRPLLINLVLDDDPAIAAKYPFVKKEGRTLFSEITIPHFNNGRGAALWFTASPLYNRNGDEVGAIESIREITERKQAEEDLVSANREYINLLDQIQDVYYRSDTGGRLVRASRSWATLLGYDDIAECIGRSIAEDFYINPPDRKGLQDEIYRNGKVTGYEVLLKKKDGTPVLVEASSHLYFDPAGNIIGIEGTFRDITARKKADAELRAAYGQITANEEKFRSIVETSPDIIWEIDLQGRFRYISPRVAAIIGYTPEEIIGRPLIDLVPEQAKSDITQELARYGSLKGSLSPVEVPARHRDGHDVILEIRPALSGTNGNLKGFRGVAVDITERKRAEKALRLSEKRFRELADLLPQGVYEADTNGRMTFVNRLALEMSGYTGEDIEKGLNALNVIAPEDRQRAAMIFRQMAEQGTRTQGSAEYKGLRKDGTTFPVSIFSSPVISDGRIVGVRGVIMDITEQKRAADELRAANEQLVASDEELRTQYDELALSEAKIRLSEARLTSMLGFYEYAQKGERELLGYAIEGAGIVTGSSLGYLAFLNEDESELSMYAWSKSAMAECSMREKPIIYKTENTGLWGEAVRQRRPVITNDYAAPNPAKKGYPRGHPKITRHMNVPVIDEGHIVLVAGVANKRSDYTENDVNELLLLMQGLWSIIKRRQVQEEQKAAYEQLAAADEELQLQYEQLRKSEEDLRLLKISVDQSADEVFWLDFEGNILYVNDAACRINGYSRDEFLAMKIYDLNPDITHEIWVGSVTDLRARKTQLFTTRHRHRDGTIIDVEIMSVYVNQDGREYSFAFVRDITERKKVEAALFESVVKFRAVIDQSFEFVGLMTPDGTLIEANRAALALVGISESGVINRPFWETPWWSHSQELQEKLRDAIHRAASGETVRFEATHHAADGDLIYIDFSVKPVVDPTGKILYLIPEGRDITERKRTEEALRESEEKFRALVESTSDFIWEVDAAGIYTYISPQVRHILGYNPEDMLGKTPFDFMPPDEGTSVAVKFRRCVDSRLPLVALENKAFKKDGSVVILETSGVVRRAKDGSFEGYRGIDRDITARKQAEEALTESEARLSSILHGSPVLQFVIDRSHKVISWNNALEEYSGIRAADMIGTDRQWRAFYPEKRPVLADLLMDGDTEKINRLYAGKLRKSRYVEEAYEATDFFPHMGSSGIWLSFTAAPIRNETGAIIGAIETLEDVTERISSEKALRESDAWTRTILNTAQAGIVLVDANTHRIVDANRKALELIGLPQESVIGAVCHRFICPAEKGKCPVTDLGQEVNTSERVLLAASGARIPVLKTVVRVSIGGRDLLVESFVDISEQKRSEEAIREANRKLNLLNSITRHDIRNQLMVAHGYTQLAALNKPDPVITDFLVKITAAIETIQRQIEFTKAYQELGVHAPAWFSVAEVIGSVRPEKITVRISCEAIEIFADPMIDKVFFNLFDNAVKYGERVTSVTVGCEQKDSGLVITFADNGVGIPPGEKTKIFEKGYGKNTGFGLFLAREILAITGITISETGTHGKGAVFEITVPEGAFRKAG